MLKIRSSQLGLVMTPAKKAGELSAGAKTWIKQQFKRDMFNYDDSPDSKYMEKGVLCEADSISLYNDVFFTDWQKNTDRLENDWITGECDIFTGSTIIDLKTSWSLATFPVFPDDAENLLYEWQLRAYMMLWDANESELAYCMVDTPEHLIGYDDISLHQVSHIDPTKRITRLFFKRDAEKESEIIRRVTACREYYEQLAEQYAALHR